jgi:hypothetical protein
MTFRKSLAHAYHEQPRFSIEICETALVSALALGTLIPTCSCRGAKTPHWRMPIVSSTRGGNHAKSRAG